MLANGTKHFTLVAERLSHYRFLTRIETMALKFLVIWCVLTAFVVIGCNNPGDPVPGDEITAAPTSPTPTSRGDLDQAFGSNGTVTANFYSPQPSNLPHGLDLPDGWDELESIKEDTVGRIIAVGTARYSIGCRGEIAIARYGQNGLPDNTFGTLPPNVGFPNENQTRITYNDPDIWSTEAIAADMSGDAIVVLARTQFQWKCACGEGMPLIPCPPDTATESLRVVRITPAGDLDPNFGNLGWAEFDFNSSSDEETEGGAIVVMPDGKVVVCGNHFDQNGMHMVLARYDGASGNLDLSFHGDGKWELDFGGISSFCWDLAVQEDGKVIVAGGLNSPSLSLVLIRLLPDGSEDPSFGANGRKIMPTLLGGAKFVALRSSPGQPNDDLFVVTQEALLKFDHSGDLDVLGFGTNGIVNLHSDNLFPGGVAVDSDGTIFVVGTDALGPTDNLGRPGQFFVQAFQPDGDPDSTFNGGRVTTQAIPQRMCFTPGKRTHWGGGLLLQESSNRVITAGTTEPQALIQNDDFALVAFHTR